MFSDRILPYNTNTSEISKHRHLYSIVYTHLHSEVKITFCSQYTLFTFWSTYTLLSDVIHVTCRGTNTLLSEVNIHYFLHKIRIILDGKYTLFSVVNIPCFLRYIHITFGGIYITFEGKYITFGGKYTILSEVMYITFCSKYALLSTVNIHYFLL